MKLRGLLSLFLCILLTALLLSSCGGDEVKALYFAVDASAGTFDPTIASDRTARIIVRNCFEGLVRVDETGSVLPGAAQSWEISPDGLTYTFRIRPDAVWHLTSNAKEQLEGKLPEDFDLRVTAYDFAFGLKRALDPAMGAPDAHLLTAVAGAEAVLAGRTPTDSLGIRADSADTLTITLSHPQTDFLTVLAEPLCMPCSETFFNACGGRYGLFIKYSLSNGPFYLSYFDDTTYRISKSPDYTGPFPPAADVVRLYVCTDTDTLYTKLRSADYSGARMTEEQFEGLDLTKKMSAVSVADRTRAFLLNAASDALSDTSVRMAFILATDTEKFAAASGRQAVFDPVPAAAARSDRAGASAFNEEKAKALLSAALERSGQSSVTATLKCEKRFETALKKQLQHWQKLFGTSFIINVECVSGEQLAADVKSGDYDIAFYPVGAPSVSAAAFFDGFLSGAEGNIFGTDDEELDSAVRAYAGAASDDRSEAYTRVCAGIASNAVILPVWSESTYFVCAKDVGGVILLPGEDSVYFYNCE